MTVEVLRTSAEELEDAWDEGCAEGRQDRQSGQEMQQNISAAPLSEKEKAWWAGYYHGWHHPTD